jgi:acetyl-CoA carboxylase biotin carboxyl carrier protein
MQITLKQLKGLLKTLEEGGASEFEYQDEKYRVRLALSRAPLTSSPVVFAAPASNPLPARAPGEAASAELADPSVAFVTSPFVGTFYRAAAPDSEPFVDVGRAVRAGQTLCIVEAMKLMNEIEAEFAGTILEILVENGESVEFGQKLFKIRKT